MHILVTNDDGPPSNQSSPYIHSFVKTLQAAGHTVSVVLPHQQRSWIGKAHFASQIVKPTYFRPGTLHQDDGTTHTKPLHPDSSVDSEEWVLVNSTPATAAQLGLFHFFQDRGPVDLVVSGPNYGRNTTSLFSLSSGTLGGAMEAAVCKKRAVALSYAFFSRNHDPEIIAAASGVSVRVIEHLWSHWNEAVDLYSVNVPLIEGVEAKKVLYTHALQNYWQSGSSFTEIEASGDEDEDPAEKEAEIRDQEVQQEGGESQEKRTRHKHRHFKWSPNFTDVYQSVEVSEPGNDGWAIKEGFTSVTPLKANFMHVQGLSGELKLSSDSMIKRPKIYAHVDYHDSYTHPIILAAISSILPSKNYTFLDSLRDMPDPQSPLLEITAYETIPFQHLLDHPTTSLACSYVIRKALIRKHYLSHTVQSYLTKHPEGSLRTHVPLAVDFELDYAEFLDEALVEAYELHEAFAKNKAKNGADREWWILKPSMIDRGQGIRLFSTESELHDIFQQWEDDQPEPSEDEEDSYNTAAAATRKEKSSDEKLKNGIITSQLRHFVAQPYILPLLPPEYNNRKFHIRTYVLCVGALRVYVYKEMLALFAELPFQTPGIRTASSKVNGIESHSEKEIDMRPHLTNTCLQTIPSPSPNSNFSEAKVIPFRDLISSLLTPAKKSSIYNQIFETTSDVLRAAAAQPTNFQPLPNAFEIYGVDWLVDPDFQVHLLEFNAYPDFAQSGPEGRRVVEGLWRGVLGIVLRGDGRGNGGFFGDVFGDGDGTRREVEDWGMEMVLDLDMGRR